MRAASDAARLLSKIRFRSHALRGIAIKGTTRLIDQPLMGCDEKASGPARWIADLEVSCSPVGRA